MDEYQDERHSANEHVPHVPAVIAFDDEWEGHGAESETAASWRRQLPRWLATLNPGRTQREYEKAVSYFFETPGVPQELPLLGFDLLLAYRGALALRATAHQETASPPTRRERDGQARLAGSTQDALPGSVGRGGASWQHERAALPGPLAPATVNLRLTALRQFLVFCALFGDLPQLTPDRIRAALHRLHVERRRPYQVLAEPEWALFLQAAQLPTRLNDAHAMEERPDGQPAEQATGERAPDAEEGRASPPRSVDGLTGEKTAQRDHALLALALASGLRAIELASLDVGDLTREWHAGREEWWLILPDEKTKGQHGGRTLPLAPDLVATLTAYLRATGRSWERAADHSTPLFLSGPATWVRRRGTKSVPPPNSPPALRPFRRLSPRHIQRIVERVEGQWHALRARAAGIEPNEADEAPVIGESRRISPHALRHSTAVALLEGNEAAGRPPASVEHVRGWLGHFDIRTTQGYLAHLEARKYRRPFTLAPSGSQQPAGEGSRGSQPGAATVGDAHSE